MIIGTVGHADHGKTARVKALTGVDTEGMRPQTCEHVHDLSLRTWTMALLR